MPMSTPAAETHGSVVLLSTSQLHNQDYLAYALEPISVWLNHDKELLFVPYALADHNAYTDLVQHALAPLGVRVTGIHTLSRAQDTLAEYRHVFVGGGNTFRLLNALQVTGLSRALHTHVTQHGGSYLGSSAGTNVACPSIKTTNDMPIVEPATLTALGLVPFQINPHYADPDPRSTHMGETRATRLEQYLEENSTPVIGLREGSWLSRTPTTTYVLHGRSARLFRRQHDACDVESGTELTGDLTPV